MTTRTSDPPALPGERAEVVSWLRGPDGEEWTRARIGASLECHDDDSGVFAEMIDDGHHGLECPARWPVPFKHHDLARVASFDY